MNILIESKLYFLIPHREDHDVSTRNSLGLSRIRLKSHLSSNFSRWASSYC